MLASVANVRLLTLFRNLADDGAVLFIWWMESACIEAWYGGHMSMALSVCSSRSLLVELRWGVGRMFDERRSAKRLEQT